MSMMPVAEAQVRLLAMAPPVSEESTPVAEACGRWTRADIDAVRSQPATDLSAMDGYAVRFADPPGAWRVIGESAAGAAFMGAVGPGEAVRIYTGAAMPEGADTVILQEDVARDGDALTMTGEGPGERGRHVRKAGSDFACGQCIIPAGTRLSSRHIGLAALAGHGALILPRLPRIALISTGSELVLPGEPTRTDQIPASNALMLGAMLAALPCEAVDMGLIPDRIDTLTACFADARDYDIVVSIGGASVGDHDLVKPALEAAGGAIDFWKIAMRPGKPLIAGRLGDALFIGLPGNPVSAFVTALLFLLPVVRKAAGSPDPLLQAETARLGSAIGATGGREDYVRAIVEDGVVNAIGAQDSAATLALSQANCLIRRPAGSAAARAGDEVEIVRF